MYNRPILFLYESVSIRFRFYLILFFLRDLISANIVKTILFKIVLLEFTL